MNEEERNELSDVLVQISNFDYSFFVGMFASIAYYYVVPKVSKEFELCKDFKPKKISEVVLPPELKQEYSSVDLDKLASESFGNALLEFTKVITSNFKKEDLSNFYNNINNLQIQQKESNFNFKASYHVIENTIRLDLEDYSSSIYHELFHMASSTYSDGIKFSGFRQYSTEQKISDIGIALNEGYTQLLTERYFNHIDGLYITYEFEVSLAKKLEKIVGQDKMESLYMNSNLAGLINELKQYSTEKEIMEFITGSDFLKRHVRDQDLLPFERSMIERCLEKVNLFLLKAYAVKTKKQIDSGTADIRQLEESMYKYIYHLGSKAEVGENTYNYLSIDTVRDTLANILEENDSKSMK